MTNTIKTTSPQSIEACILDVQMMLAEEFDFQMRMAVSQLKFLGRLKETYREKTQTVQEFLAQNQEVPKNGGKKKVNTGFATLEKVYGAFSELNYNLDNQTIDVIPFQIQDNGDKHSFDIILPKDASGKPHALSKTGLDKVFVISKNGESSSVDWARAFSTGAKIANNELAHQFAARAPGKDNSSLPFVYEGKSDEAGRPLFTVFTESFETMLEKLKSLVGKVEEDVERLTAKLTQLSNQRKATMDNVKETMRKTDEVRNKVLNKQS